MAILTHYDGFTQHIPDRSGHPDDFIPEGWKILLDERGDLNHDGMDDLVLVIEDTNPENFKPNDGLDVDTLNLNPRMLLVLLKTDTGYTLGGKNTIGFIPSQNTEDSPCLADPLMESGGIEISNGSLKIFFNYWLSCGSYYVNQAGYTFRYQKSRFELIGFDHNEYHRASGDEHGISINFSTGRKSETSGGNLFDEAENNPETVWSEIRVDPFYILENCSAETYFELLEL